MGGGMQTYRRTAHNLPHSLENSEAEPLRNVGANLAFSKLVVALTDDLGEC
jgi:hypothetical protein